MVFLGSGALIVLVGAGAASMLAQGTSSAEAQPARPFDPFGVADAGAPFSILAGDAAARARAPSGTSHCPADARLVVREHWEKVEHVCTDQRGKYCFAFEPGVVQAEEPRTPIRVCMDTYEAPNVRGQRPIVMKNASEAEEFCGKRKKRLCSEAEWEVACEGDAKLPYVYGWKSDIAICNSGKAWRPFSEAALRAGGATADDEVARLWQGEPSGSYPGCVSREGVQDLMGNVEEWVSSRPERQFRAALKGGFWAKPWSTCRGTNDAHDMSFRFYEVGFRCCADPT